MALTLKKLCTKSAQKVNRNVSPFLKGFSMDFLNHRRLGFHISKYHTIGYRYSPCVFKQIQKCENEVIKNSPVYTGKLSVQLTSRL